MKRTIVIAVVILAGLVVLILLIAGNRNRPRFVTDDTPHYAPYRVLTFSSHPPQIAGGKLWLSTWSATNDFRSFLLDVTRRRIVGRLVHGVPLAVNSNGTRVLCLQRNLHNPGAMHKVRAWVDEVVLRKTTPAWDIEVLWILDLADNSVVKIGAVRRSVNRPTIPAPSPSFRHVLLQGAPGGNAGAELYLCDLEEKTVRELRVGSPQAGWWNERQVLVFSAGGYETYDIYTHQRSALLPEAQMSSFLEDNTPGAKLSSTARFYMPRGHAVELYLAPESKGKGDNPLIEFDRTNATLKTVPRKFNRNWIGVLDPTGRYFLFHKRGSGGIYLHDFQTDEVRTLVPSDNKPLWFQAFFHGDQVLYVRSNVLWQIDFQGSNNVLLFPPPK